VEEKLKIELLMREFNLNSAQFAEEVGIKNSTLSHILNDRNKTSLDVLKKILSKYPQINPEWLILDQGTAFRKINNSQEPTLFDNLNITTNKTDSYYDNSTKNADEKKINSVSKAETAQPKNEMQQKIDESAILSSVVTNNSKIISKIIIYFTDKTFQEFSPSTTSN